MFRSTLLALLALCPLFLPLPASADALIAPHSAGRPPTAGPVHIHVGLSGERLWTRMRVLADLSEAVARDPDLVLTRGLPEAVERGLQRGYLLEVRLQSALTRDGGRRLLRCAMHQSIFDLRTKALRGSATQRGTIELVSTADGQTLSGLRDRCFAALVPAVHEGVGDYLARARR